MNEERNDRLSLSYLMWKVVSYISSYVFLSHSKEEKIEFIQKWRLETVKVQ